VITLIFKQAVIVVAREATEYKNRSNSLPIQNQLKITHRQYTSTQMIANSSGAVKRLRKELLLLERSAKSKGVNTPEHDDIYLRPTSPDSILRWTALIRGPPDVSKEASACHSTYDVQIS